MPALVWDVWVVGRKDAKGMGPRVSINSSRNWHSSLIIAASRIQAAVLSIAIAWPLVAEVFGTSRPSVLRFILERASRSCGVRLLGSRWLERVGSSRHRGSRWPERFRSSRPSFLRVYVKKLFFAACICLAHLVRRFSFARQCP